MITLSDKHTYTRTQTHPTL